MTGLLHNKFWCDKKENSVIFCYVFLLDQPAFDTAWRNFFHKSYQIFIVSLKKVVPKGGWSLRPHTRRSKQTIALPSVAEVLSFNRTTLPIFVLNPTLTAEWGGVKIPQKSVHMAYEWPLWKGFLWKYVGANLWCLHLAGLGVSLALRDHTDISVLVFCK